jgi:hypothetical protein
VLQARTETRLHPNQLTLPAQRIPWVTCPRIHIPPQQLAILLMLGYNTRNLARIYGISRWTVNRRRRELNINDRRVDDDLIHHMINEIQQIGRASCRERV